MDNYTRKMNKKRKKKRSRYFIIQKLLGLLLILISVAGFILFIKIGEGAEVFILTVLLGISLILTNEKAICI